ncbi:XRE family transcriptional regulator [Variovorax sp. H27-G14]|uniref:helix-turn-helix domain-containing protein n=1 Tax=Variovorax sp. H27-G14 TaxID=3111914 RepID=UPI0038FCCB40
MKKTQPQKEPLSESAALAGRETGVLADIGEALRARRRLLHLSLAEVAERSELSIGYISLLERNLASPSLTALMRIGQVLGLELDYFFQARNAGGHHFPQSARSPFQLQSGGMTFDRISGQFPGSVVNGLVVTIPARHKSTPITHPGEELVYILSGSLRYTLGGRTVQLDEGDSVHLPSTTPHCWENPFAQPAKALWVGTAPLFKADGGDPHAAHDLQSHGSPTRVSGATAAVKGPTKASTRAPAKALTKPKARPSRKKDA